jgi:hypothetical protein
MTNSRVGKYALIAALVLNASNAQAQSALGVYDATNKFVGNLIDNQLVGLIINGTVAALPFDVEGLQEGNGVIFLMQRTVKDGGTSAIRPCLLLVIMPVIIPSIMQNSRLKR